MYEESVKRNTDVIRNALGNLDSIGIGADEQLSDAITAIAEANATIDAISTALRYTEDMNLDLVDWAKEVYLKAYMPTPAKDSRVRGWMCWGSLFGGNTWDERAACEQVDHLSVTQKWNKWSSKAGFTSVSSAANKYSKGFCIAVHPGLGPELPPDIQTLVPQNQRVTTLVKGNTSWLCPWWIDEVRNAWMLGPIQQAANLHGSDPQLRMIRAAIPPMQSGEPYFDGAPSPANMKKWIAAWKASGKAVGLTDDQAWNQLCDDYYKTMALFIEFLAVTFPESVMIAVAAGIGMGDQNGDRLKAMLSSLRTATLSRICLQHNGLNPIPKTDGSWSPQESTDEWVITTSRIAQDLGVVLGYQPVTGAMGGGPGPMGPQMFDESLQVGVDLGMSYCEIYSVDIDAVVEGNQTIADILDKHDLTK